MYARELGVGNLLRKANLTTLVRFYSSTIVGSRFAVWRQNFYKSYQVVMICTCVRVCVSSHIKDSICVCVPPGSVHLIECTYVRIYLHVCIICYMHASIITVWSPTCLLCIFMNCSYFIHFSEMYLVMCTDVYINGKKKKKCGPTHSFIAFKNL